MTSSMKYLTGTFVNNYGSNVLELIQKTDDVWSEGHTQKLQTKMELHKLHNRNSDLSCEMSVDHSHAQIFMYSLRSPRHWFSLGLPVKKMVMLLT
jgi:hypothetical protein